MNRSTLTLTTIVAALALAPALFAQDPPRPRPAPPDAPPAQERMQRLERARMGARTLGMPAAAVLRLRERLELTDAQVARLEALAAAQREALGAQAPELMRARADLLEATRNDIDLAAARRALDRMAQLRTEAAMARLTAQKEVRDVLTAEQRGRLDALRTAAPRGMGPAAPRMRPGQQMRFRARPGR